MSQPTQRYKRTLKGSIGAGMQSLMGSGRRFYILEHKVSSKYHKAGENQQIIVDQIELGRASTCQVRFDESFSTVSRRHAAIIKDGDNWKLIQLSKTNSTFLNGRPVQKEWYLQNGDEIQLSVNGPKLGFITLAGKKGTVGSLRLTRRLNLFRQQALRPYKYAIATLAACLIIAVVGLGGWNWKLREDLRNQSLQLAEQIIRNQGNKEMVDSLAKQLAAANEKIASADKKIGSIKKGNANTRIIIPKPSPNPSPTPSPNPEKKEEEANITSCYPYTYLVNCFIVDEKGNPITYKNDEGKDCYVRWSGTGFLLNNGYFVTAHHMIHWDNISINKDSRTIDANGISSIVNTRYYAGVWKIRMIGISSSGDKIDIIYSYTNCPFRTGNSKTAQETVTDNAGRSWILRIHRYSDGSDWACLKVNKSGGLSFNGSYSKNMPPKTKLTLLGFPAGMDKTQNGKVSPDVSEAITSRQGLEDEGWIRTSNENTDHGNSGGPVFTQYNGKLIVVGLCSGANDGSDNTHRKGRIVPIGAIFN